MLRYDCSIDTGIPDMTFHYRLGSSRLHGRLELTDNVGWLAVGFAVGPSGAANQMIGATAVIGARFQPQRVRLYQLSGTGVNDVKPLTSAQDLADAVLEDQGRYTAIAFSLPLYGHRDLVGVGEGVETHFIFARGYENALGYHGYAGGRSSVSLALDVPHEPPSPPPSPMLPSQIEVVIVTATLTLDVPAFAFGEATLAKLKWSLAAALGTTPSAVTLTVVSSGAGRRLSESDPVVIEASIHFTSAPAATAAVDKLELFAADPQAASDALEVPITSVAAPKAVATWVTKPPPTLPPAPPAQPIDDTAAPAGNLALTGEDAGMSNGALIGIIVGAACGMLVAGGIYLYWKRRRGMKPPPPPPAEGEARPKKKKRHRGTVWVNIGMSRGEGKEDAPEDAERTMTMKIGSSSDEKPPPPPQPPPGPPPPLLDHDDVAVARI